MEPLQASYILPLKSDQTRGLAELCAYLNALPVSDVIVVDGSPPWVFEHMAHGLNARVRHVGPQPEIQGRNGKVRNVLTGLRYARHERVIVADDDVRYDAATLGVVLDALERADVIRPQNYFEPLPWHALLDTGRILLNRALDGDWPGTLAFKKSMLPGGYNADVLFENYELVQTIKARGGRECVARDIYVRRHPPTAAHFGRQRVRQAYDEFARPVRLVSALAILPLCAVSAFFGAWEVPAALFFVIVALAAFGRTRDGGSRYFPVPAVIAAPIWALERAVCAWLALYERIRYGGARYAGGVVRDAASRPKELRQWAV